MQVEWEGVHCILKVELRRGSKESTHPLTGSLASPLAERPTSDGGSHRGTPCQKEDLLLGLDWTTHCCWWMEKKLSCNSLPKWGNWTCAENSYPTNRPGHYWCLVATHYHNPMIQPFALRTRDPLSRSHAPGKWRKDSHSSVSWEKEGFPWSGRERLSHEQDCGLEGKTRQVRRKEFDCSWFIHPVCLMACRRFPADLTTRTNCSFPGKTLGSPLNWTWKWKSHQVEEERKFLYV